MGKEILTFGNIETEKQKKNFTVVRLLFFWGDKDVEKVSNKISLGEKTIRPLLVTCIMVIPLYH